MEAKDTVMSEEQISNAKKGHTAIIQAHPSVYEQDYAVARAQAEISFKAGYEKGRTVCPTNEVQGTIYLEGKQAGIKEVAEWVNTHTNFAEPHPFGRLEWQAKLKEWKG